jgi:anaerobic magnesium-protoporphyrin IX monomethyl ester cyclase
MRVALIGPDLEENLSIRYLASALAAAGHVPRIVRFDSADDLPRARAEAGDADLVGLSMCYQVRAPEFLTLASLLKQDRADRPVVAGGHFASCAATELLEQHPALDVVAIHEGERTIVELASLPEWTTEALCGVQGIVHRGAGGITRTAPRPIVADLDELAWADRSGPIRLVVGVPTAYMMGSRGCLGACDYCAITTLHRLAPGKRFRQRSPEAIADEMAWLYHERGVRQFVFHDDNFLVPAATRNLERIDALERALRRRGVRRIGLVLKCRPAEVDPAVFRRLRELGLLRVFLGVESATPEGLESIGRRQTVDEAERALEVCEDLGISSQYTVITFHPEATPETILADLRFVRRHLAHPLSFCRAELYAGTPLERRMLEAGRAEGSYLAREYSYSDPRTSVVWTAARSLLAARCWSSPNLLGQAIQLDHLATAYEHFYEGRDVDALVSDFRAWQLEVNRDSLELFEELVTACSESSTEPALLELREREREATARLTARCCELRATLHACSQQKCGLAPAAAPTSSAPHFGRLQRHAAAALLAIGLAGGCSDDTGVIEAPPPPMDKSVKRDGLKPDSRKLDGVKHDFGVIEAPPPAMDRAVKHDAGVIEAPPPPHDAK